MNLKKFEYQHKDTPFLKRDIAVRFLFSILFFAIAVWQFIIMAINLVNNTLSTTMLITSLFVIILSVIMFVCAMMYAFKDFRVISTIKKRGKCVSSVQVLFKINKRSFMKLYLFLNSVLSLATSLVLIASITYSILQATYYASISFYLPILVLLCFVCFNTVFHVNHEIKTMEQVKEHHAIY